jgi:RNA polymerase sigma-70 factor (ECF subfamily)
MGCSFDDVFAAEFEPLHGFVARHLGSSAAEELTAETFAVAYRRWSDLDPSRSPKPWLYGIASNLISHHRRRERRMLRAYARSGNDPLLAEDGFSIERLAAQESRSILAAALADLRHEEREALLLHAWAELSDREIAEALSVPLGTVKSRLSRARTHIRNQIGVSGQVEVDGLNTIQE